MPQSISVAIRGASGSENTSYTYDSANRNLTTTFADGSVETDGYSGTTADLTSVSHVTSSSSTITSYAYTFNSDGRKTQATLADGSYYTYGYDSAGQLTSESLSSGGSGTVGALHGYSYTYTYDSAGNRSSKYNGTSTETYTYDSANKLTAAGVKSYTYDNAGSVTSVYNSSTGITTTLGYDGESRMTSASNNPTSGAYSDTFAYNGNDQRYAKSDSTGSFGYTRQDDAIDSPVLSDGAAVYNHGAGEGLVSEIRGSASKFYHSDALGSTAALTNASGSTTDTLVTDAYGMTVTGSGSTPTPFGFVGQENYQGDSDTGLMLLGHRYYDASTGRFLSRDPVQAGNNWYTYCSNDPINDIDPSGYLAAVIVGGLVAIGPVGWWILGGIVVVAVIVVVAAKIADNREAAREDAELDEETNQPQAPEASPPGTGSPLPPEKDPNLRNKIHREIADYKQVDGNPDVSDDDMNEAIENAKRDYKKPTRQRGVGRGGNWPGGN